APGRCVLALSASAPRPRKSSVSDEEVRCFQAGGQLSSRGSRSAMQINLIEIWHDMGFLVRCVVALLTVQAVCCVAVTIDRIVLLTRSSNRARAFAASVQSAMDAGAYESVLSDAALQRDNHL